MMMDATHVLHRRGLICKSNRIKDRMARSPIDQRSTALIQPYSNGRSDAASLPPALLYGILLLHHRILRVVEKVGIAYKEGRTKGGG